MCMCQNDGSTNLEMKSEVIVIWGEWLSSTWDPTKRSISTTPKLLSTATTVVCWTIISPRSATFVLQTKFVSIFANGIKVAASSIHSSIWDKMQRHQILPMRVGGDTREEFLVKILLIWCYWKYLWKYISNSQTWHYEYDKITQEMNVAIL